MNYQLHYAKLENDGDVPLLEFKSFVKMVRHIDATTISRHKDRVYLIAVEIADVIIIEHNLLTVFSLIEKFKGYRVFFFQEYASYEEAYKVALDMREPNKLCYDNNTFN